MQKYLSLRQTSQVCHFGSWEDELFKGNLMGKKGLTLFEMQDKDVPVVRKKTLFCFRVMSRSFADPIKAEESFQILDQLKDANIWKILTNLVDPNTSIHQARVCQVNNP